MFWALNMSAHSILRKDIRSLTCMVGDNWDQLPLIQLNSSDVLNISFDQLSHDYHQYTYEIQHCEADWTPSSQLMESDFLVGINGSIIEDYELSINTNHIYTHYSLQVPNSKCRLRMSGNYEMTIRDDDEDRTPIAVVRFYVLENVVTVGLGMTTNTDIDVNKNHQQVKLSIDYSGLQIVNPSEQIYVTVLQNGMNGITVENPKPDVIKSGGMQFLHCRPLIFEAGNEYRKYEVLSVYHTNMNTEEITWNGHDWYAELVQDVPRPNYIYDEDVDGYFYIRNSDDTENETTSEYLFVDYNLKSPYYPGYKVYVNGAWTNNDQDEYLMEYNELSGTYHASILQKFGYYNYRYVMIPEDGGKTVLLPSQGSFFQTQNSYEALVYYKEIGGRTYRLVGFAGLY